MDIFITSLTRSGSSLLSTILNNHSKIYVAKTFYLIVTKFFLQSLTCNQIDKASVRFFKKNPWRIIKNQTKIKNFLKTKKFF